jgi:hypothetical protein
VFGIGQAFRDLLAPLFQDCKDGAIGKPVENKANNAEADYLRNQVLPIHAERPGDLFELTTVALIRQQYEHIHDLKPPVTSVLARG